MSETTDFGPNRALELIRRLCLLCGALATMWLALKPADMLYRVRNVNFATLQKQDAERMRSSIKMLSRESSMDLDPNDPIINIAPTLSPEQYIAKQTKDRLIEVSGSQWAEFYDGVQKTLLGTTKTFARNVSLGYGSYFLYFPADTAPLNELAHRIGPDKVFTYVALRNGDNVKYMEVLFQRPQSAYQEAPNWLLYPLREYAVWCFIAGLLAYAAIPWYRKGPDELRYSTARAIVVPDILGVLLTVFFCVLPILVISTNAHSDDPVDIFGFRNGWWPITLVMWLMACAGLATLFVSLWYACYTMKITPAGLCLRKLFSDNEYTFSEMEAIEPARWAWPWWLRILVILISLSKPRLAGPAILGAFEEAHGIAIRMKNGYKLKLWMTHLPGFQQIFHALRKTNVPMNAELAKIIDEDIAENITGTEPEQKPGKGGKIAAGILMALTIAGLLAWRFSPEKTRVVKHELQFSYEQLAQRMELTKQMMNLAGQMKDKGGTPEFDKLMQQINELEKRYNAIRPTEED
jgi:hypothetical protein